MKSFINQISNLSLDSLVSDYPVAFYVCAGVVGFLVFLAVILAPLLIWRHAAKIRRELQIGQKLIAQQAQALKEEQEKTNALAVEMQQRYLKTMQYVCDRLADICDGINGFPFNSAAPHIPGAASGPSGEQASK